MKVDIITPKPGESIDEVEVSSWLKADGDFVGRLREPCGKQPI